MNDGVTDLLNGKIFISTRPAGKSEELKHLLQNQGARLIEIPMIEIQKAEITDAEKQMLLAIKGYQWIIFTSANGIDYFFENLKTLTGSIHIGEAKIAVIGTRSAKELDKYGYTAGYINPGKTAEDFVKGLLDLFGNTLPDVLLPVGNLAGNTLEEGLKHVSNISRVNVYNTLMPDNIESEALKSVIDNNYEMVIFTSPSGFVNFCRLAEERFDLSTLRVACIGTTTAQALVEKRITPLLISNVMSSEGIAKAIIDYYK